MLLRTQSFARLSCSRRCSERASCIGDINQEAMLVLSAHSADKTMINNVVCGQRRRI